MGRLFDKSESLDIEVGQIVRNGEPVVDMDSLYEAEDSVAIVAESFKPVNHYYETVKHIEQALSGKNTILAAEAYNPLLKSLAHNLGYKAAIPALEDYNNPFAAKASKEVALESLKGFLRKIWESIRKFFLDFFRKVSEFTKRLINANLQIDTYERYVPDLLKKINREGLKCSDPTKEVNTKLVALLAPEGLDRLDGVWVPQNIRPIVQETIIRLDVLTKNIFPSLIKETIPNIFNTVSTLYGNIDRMSVEGEILDTLAKCELEVKQFIVHSVKTICPVETDSRNIPEDAFEQLSNLLIDNSMSDLKINSFTDNSKPIGRLPKNFNLIMAISNEDKVYSVTVTEENQSKSTTIPVLPDIKALELVFDQYKDLSKKFDIKYISKIFLDIDKTLNSFVVQLPKMLDSYKAKYENFSLDGLLINFVSQNDALYLKVLQEGVEAVLERFSTNELYKEYMRLGGAKRVDELTLIDLGNMKEFIVTKVIPHHGSSSEFDDKDVVNAGKDLVETITALLTAIKGNTDDSGTPISAVIVKEINEVEKLLMNYIQNLQVALRAVETTFPSIVTDLRYELLKYVYDSARQFE